MYKIRDDVPEARVVELEEILRGCGRYIPQLLYSVVARNLSDIGISLVWEHAYESAESYEEYMRHPYHICVLDRYLLPDAPGLIIENDGLGLGLLGYEIEEPAFLRRDGIRRVVAFQIDAQAGSAEREALVASLAEASSRAPELQLSLVAENTMGAEWFPGAWSHIWEQAFDSTESLRDYLAGDSSPAQAERAWRSGGSEIVKHSVDVFYPVHEPR
jgi:hypothetical protein